MLKKLLPLLLLALAAPAWAQGPSSAQIEANKGKLKLYPTAQLPTICGPGTLVYDSTTQQTKQCQNDAATWAVLGSFTGGTITSPILAPAANNCASVPYSFTGDTGTGICSDSAGQISFYVSGTRRGYLNAGVMSAVGFTWDGNTSLESPALDTLVQRRGTNAQTYHWRHTDTDASNYQGGALKTSATGIEIAAETAGSGADNLDVTITPAGTGKVVVGGTASPAATDACTQWSVTVDANYIYVCTATGVWKRAALTGGY